jgi:hypothetical protein
MAATPRTYQVGVTRQNPVPGTVVLRNAPKRRLQVLSARAGRDDLRYPTTIKALFGNVTCIWNSGRWTATIKRLVDTRIGAAAPVVEVA